MPKKATKSAKLTAKEKEKIAKEKIAKEKMAKGKMKGKKK